MSSSCMTALDEFSELARSWAQLYRTRETTYISAGRALAERAVAAVQASGDELISRALSTAEMARLAGLLRKLLLAVEP
jgi:hypothetical protein